MKEPCTASKSGICLSMVEGFGACDGDDCDYEVSPDAIENLTPGVDPE